MNDRYYLIQYSIGIIICSVGIGLFLIQAILTDYWFTAMILIPLLGIGLYLCIEIFLQEKDELKMKKELQNNSTVNK